MTARVRVLLHASAPDGRPDAVENAYHHISRALEATPGLLGNELLGSLSAPGSFVVMSEWEDEQAFRTWESGSDHRSTTGPLRPFQNPTPPGPFGIFEVLARY